MACVSTTSFSIKVNGEGYGYFDGRKGLKQGDPSYAEALKHFSEMTSLIANVDKSNMVVAGVDTEMKEKLVEMPGFAVGTFPIRYLGLPLLSKRWKKMERHQLTSKITEKIRTYSAKNLSYGVLKEVDRKCREFLWGNNAEQKKVSLVAWEKICKPKAQGGLNVKGCRNWNIATMTKLIWMLLEKADNLWVK
ncbi:uncharacterized protein LOC142175960 [Nicotiana tabacum]|uniref:Uncharacterized protein LOC142175960 n=1 Tax=Nicotiana tabacum TaxID=4097 RepID=A0AC58TPC5_TOBAC